MNSNIINNLGFSGITYRLRNYSSFVDTPQGGNGGLLNKANDYLKSWYDWYYSEAEICDQLCLTKKLQDRTIETVSTGVTLQMIKAFIKNSASQENQKVTEFLEFATGQQLNYLSQDELRKISKLLLLLNPSNSIEVIKNLLVLLSDEDLKKLFFDRLNNSHNILHGGKISLKDFINALLSQFDDREMSSFNILKSYIKGNRPKLLINGEINNKITDDFLRKILSKGAYEKLKCLEKFSEVLEYEKLTSELLIKLIFHKWCPAMFISLTKDGNFLLNHEKMTNEVLNRILSINSLYILDTVAKLIDHEKMTSEFLIEILSLWFDNEYTLKTLVKYPDLFDKCEKENLPKVLNDMFVSNYPYSIKNIGIWRDYQELVNITPECWVNVLSFPGSLDSIIDLSSTAFLGKKLTPELLEQVFSLKDPCQKLRELCYCYTLTRDYPKEKLTPELLSFFVSCDTKMLQILNWNPKLLNLGLFILQKISNRDNRREILEYFATLPEEQLSSLSSG